MKKILVTGASGFIGSHLTQMLLQRGFHVMGLYHNHKCHFSHKHFTAVKINLATTSVMQQMSMFNPSCVVHAAAVNPSVVQQNTKEEYDGFNHEVTMQLLSEFKAVSQSQTTLHQPVKFINLSTYEIYGEAVNPLGHGETDSLDPLTDYARSKAKTHAALEGLSGDLFKTINVVCSNNYGPMQSKEKLIPAVYRQLIEGQAIDLYGDGSSRRTWTFVGDTCRGILSVIEQGLLPRYHLSSNDDASVGDMVRNTHKLMLKKNLIQTLEPVINWHKAAYNPVFKMNANVSKNELQWRAETKLLQGLSLTIDHLSQAKHHE